MCKCGLSLVNGSIGGDLSAAAFQEMFMGEAQELMSCGLGPSFSSDLAGYQKESCFLSNTFLVPVPIKKFPLLLLSWSAGSLVAWSSGPFVLVPWSLAPLVPWSFCPGLRVLGSVLSRQDALRAIWTSPAHTSEAL